MKINENRQQSGITLIALVITIIVMLILVAVTISMAINGGLFDYAGKAVSDTQNAIDKEQALADGGLTIGNTYYNSIDEYLGTTVEEVVPNLEETYSAIYTENTTITQGSYTAVIPKGFAVGTSDGINTIAGGLVITDELDEDGNSIGNEFVWIPVTYTATNTDTDSNGYDDGFDAVFYRSNWEADDTNGGKRGTTKYTATTGSSYNEPYASGYATETTEYNAMLKSVYDNKGFYIGRYEAGSTVARTNTANGTTEMVVKRDAYPYIYVGWGLTMKDYTSDVTCSSKNQGLGALALSKALYANKNVGVTSTLCYSIQWDAMLDFIKDSNHNVKNSTTWGNYSNNAWKITRTSAKYSADNGETWTSILAGGKSKTSSESILLTTGASDNFVAKNIFDVAGNVYERTNEAYSSTYRVNRGGYYGGYGSYGPASNRYYYNLYDCNFSIGFRPILYIS